MIFAERMKKHLNGHIHFGHHFQDKLKSDPKKEHTKKRLLFSLVITAIVMILEGIGGVFTNSLALLSDAGHMFTHVMALGISYIAIFLGQRPSDKQRTFGYMRFEILAALFNGVFVLIVSSYIFYEAFQRLVNPQVIAIVPMLVIAVLGLVVNMITTFVLYKSTDDLNVRSAFVHMLSDLFSSAGVIVAAIVIWWTGWYQLDAVVSILIAGVIVLWGVNLVRESSNILLESTPQHIDIDTLRKDLIRRVPDVHDVHDTHVWELTSKKYCLAAHLVVDDCSLSTSNKIIHNVNRILRRKYGIAHTTLQLECVSHFLKK
ncbi:cation transporter [Candidatus Woesearchaeota archaeon]|nr:cation transporter [Candidatus Woesearchaeota archaeon]